MLFSAVCLSTQLKILEEICDPNSQPGWAGGARRPWGSCGGRRSRDGCGPRRCGPRHHWRRQGWERQRYQRLHLQRLRLWDGRGGWRRGRARHNGAFDGQGCHHSGAQEEAESRQSTMQEEGWQDRQAEGAERQTDDEQLEEDLFPCLLQVDHVGQKAGRALDPQWEVPYCLGHIHLVKRISCCPILLYF